MLLRPAPSEACAARRKAYTGAMTDPGGFDVVVVPDFRSPARRTLFEVRTLFFLGSWLENAGRARSFPLHLVCIGEPPPSVRRMASRCGASVHVREPLRINGSATLNKLRGLDVKNVTGRTLLLDVDVFVLGDISALAGLVPDGIAAAPAGIKWIPAADWRKIYAGLGQPFPAASAPTLYCELGLISSAEAVQRKRGRTTDLRRMPPYHNTGVLLAPRACALRERWVEHQRRIGELFGVNEAARPAGPAPLGRLAAWLARRRRRKVPHTVSTCDQAAFATAVESLRAEGVPFHRLPDAYHARYAHCQAGALCLDEMRIFHATSFLRSLHGWDRPGLETHVEDFIRLWQDAFQAGAHRRAQPETAALDAERAGSLVRGLYRQHVLPALEGSDDPPVVAK